MPSAAPPWHLVTCGLVGLVVSSHVQQWARRLTRRVSRWCLGRQTAATRHGVEDAIQPYTLLLGVAAGEAVLMGVGVPPLLWTMLPLHQFILMYYVVVGRSTAPPASGTVLASVRMADYLGPGIAGGLLPAIGLACTHRNVLPLLPLAMHPWGTMSVFAVQPVRYIAWLLSMACRGTYTPHRDPRGLVAWGLVAATQLVTVHRIWGRVAAHRTARSLIQGSTPYAAPLDEDSFRNLRAPAVAPPDSFPPLPLRPGAVARKGELLRECLHPGPRRTLSLHVPRRFLLRATVHEIWQAPREELLRDSLDVRFEGELGAGPGVIREWFSCVSEALSVVDGSPFMPHPESGTLILRPRSGFPRGKIPLPETYFAAGRFIAMAVYHRVPIPFVLNPVITHALVGAPITAADVETIDPDFFRHRVLSVMSPGGPARIEAEALSGEPLMFMSAPSELQPEPVELLKDGATVRVTDDSALDYCGRLVEQHFVGAFRNELSVFLAGFWSLIPMHAIGAMMTACEVQYLIAGETLDVAQLRAETISEGTHPQFDWFWDIMTDDFDSSQCAALLRFALGSHRFPLTPPGGRSAVATPPLRLELDPVPDHLPTARTCVRSLSLPSVDTKEQLKARLLMVLDHCTGFGFV